MKSSAAALLFVTTCHGQQVSLEQYTPDKTDWSTFNNKAVLNNPKNTDHSPDGIGWIARSDWLPWNGTVFDPTEYSRQELAAEICPGNTVRGLYELFEMHQPFADNANPTKAEVDKWHTISVNHVRAMVGYTEKEYIIVPDKCLHLRALWCHEKWQTDIWDNDKYPERCAESTNPHCGAGFIPDREDQQPYLPDDIEVCPKRAGSEGLFGAAKSNIPWSIKWARPFCSTLGAEGFWGGHTGPWFHRSQFGWHWNDSEPSNPNSNAGLRTKWSGPSGANKYENPDITSGRFLVNREGVNPNPRFSGYECEGLNWLSETQDNASDCYDEIMERDECGKRFMTYNTANNGCACYPTNMAICEVKHIAARLSWDFEPVEDTYDGLFIDPDEVLSNNNLPYNGRECPRIQWGVLGKAGDRSHCLQKLVEGNFSECGKKFLTWNAANGGCGCYPPSQETCEKSETIGRSGRQTYQLKVDPSYNPPTPTPPGTEAPTKAPTVTKSSEPTIAPVPDPTNAPVTSRPTARPTEATSSPTESPTSSPSVPPSASPIAVTNAPTASPTQAPVTNPPTTSPPIDTPTSTPVAAPTTSTCGKNQDCDDNNTCTKNRCNTRKNKCKFSVIKNKCCQTQSECTFKFKKRKQKCMALTCDLIKGKCMRDKDKPLKRCDSKAECKKGRCV